MAVRLRTGALDPAEVGRRLSALRAELDVPAEFPADVLAEASRSAVAPALTGHRDATDIELVTLDPPGSRDLDQAFCWERRGTSGYRLHYAIADVAAFVQPAGAVDAEARRRGETLYSPDLRTPLHPTALSEAAASLLPGQVRPALLWSVEVDAAGQLGSARVERAMVRSRAQLDYATVQADLDAGQAPEGLQLLREVGQLLAQQADRRGALNLPEPEQEVQRTEAGYALSYRAPAPSEDWNAQMSLLTGMAAAQMMLGTGVGLLRTLPEPAASVVAALRAAAGGLGVPWPAEMTYQERVRTLQVGDPPQAALCQLAASLLRGAGYTAFLTGAPLAPMHSAVAAPYAHVTAPLRRLADRFTGECCLAASAGTPVPEWVLAALPELPGLMASADQRAHALERATLDLVEALVLRDRVGEAFSAVVLQVRAKGAQVQLAEPAVRATCDGEGLVAGAVLQAVLKVADPDTRTVRLAPAIG